MYIYVYMYIYIFIYFNIHILMELYIRTTLNILDADKYFNWYIMYIVFGKCCIFIYINIYAYVYIKYI